MTKCTKQPLCLDPLQKQGSYFDCLVVTIAALCLDMQDPGKILLECGGR